ncbi:MULTISPECIES: CaiB/BaiF CoA transferase family protein [unclassified Hyphomonas]|uniref:CaiB/BaiF CoA transferase family protein n=2 Tax=Hyphomonas TaxID=85 RepID=UPI000C374E7F|nr:MULTISPECIES: CaiB/BaiF CoA-transferase family protein [unclassified Hyphomonas]MAA81537.1 formyl-CoA transferase [Hyphomonas sp.]MAN90520.1 formyl-CoA transferase [Hyphomonadaceae bacterium]HBL93317.1 formyl-CoA transferase [Hyphomonas sp.]|tara:strand:- start:1772 stop:2965 length:1194 start_codon:yes stop_codon:yes gene_type:complete
MTDSKRPLDGLRVIELGQLIAGPFCGQLLGDFGAEVIKVEAPGLPDPARGWGAVKKDDIGLFWPIIGRNKKSLTMNLRVEAGQAILRELVKTADVLVENFRPGTLERWGLGPDVLHELNPRLVITRVSGYGQTGPESHKAGYASVGEAKGGLRYLIGEPDRLPARAGVSLGDTMTGTFAALGTMMALFAREKSGKGQVVDAAIYETVMAFMESLIPEYALMGHTRERSGPILPRIAPSGVYPCSDGMVIIGANQDSLFRRLSAMCGTKWSDDARYATHDARGENQLELDEMISNWTKQRTMADVLATCEENGIPCGPVNRAKEMLEDAHIAARNAIIRVAHPVLGDVPMQGVFPKLSDTPGGVEETSPSLSEHTESILAGLGFSADQQAALRAQGVI